MKKPSLFRRVLGLAVEVTVDVALGVVTGNMMRGVKGITKAFALVGIGIVGIMLGDSAKNYVNRQIDELSEEAKKISEEQQEKASA